MNKKKLKAFLDYKADFYNTSDFIEDDPISIPHQFQKKADIEISGFLIATIAWGNRKSILNSGEKLLQIMNYAPHDFILHHTYKDLTTCEGFVHRTFNAEDLKYFFTALKALYQNYNSLEEIFVKHQNKDGLQIAIHHFKQEFMAFGCPKRTQKHISDPLKNSAAKRLNMMLRWFVRQDQNDVDFGIWQNLSPALLSCPLDVHTARVARQLGLLKRKQNDAKAVQELDKNLRKLDPKDPVKYDFALFGLGVYEGF
ncbi:TIGR02757 family protein [Mesohalobacter halotolerans]|uniref:TIGR02757 family protein n=1 Tax=Mesohalobacter halotolerans TaxID=1883405 RepID=A0A4U5TQ01_9FLAO|nr:TIGR02757 family protein [Mesohalobacter halotolerans]MBS3739295.1 TIGR02757 family protein [Psychroflexus sp.]TKS55528.1 TIGR02757 family protein [Mesohalobacter halotolerans]